MRIKLKMFAAILFSLWFSGHLSAQSDREGISLFERNKPAEAIAFLEADIASGNPAPEEYNYLGLAYYQIGNYEKAAEAFKKGTSVSGTSKKLLYFNMGNAYFAMQKWKEALDAYSMASVADPVYAAPVLNKAGTELKLDMLSEAAADYKRFFSVVNKKLVFYSESSGFYKYFQNIIEELLRRSSVTIHYITSDPEDQIFALAEKEPRIQPYYVGERKMITMFMKLDADIVCMTMPDLETYQYKRSYVRKDIEYVYIFHGMFSGLITLRKGALDHFDTLLTPTPGFEEEMRAWNRVNGLPDQKMVPCGYGVIDNMAAQYLQAYSFPKNHLGFFVSRTGENRMLLDIAQKLKERNVSMILVTANPQSSLGQMVDVAIPATDAEHMNEGGPRIFIMSSTYIMHIIWAVLMGKEEAGSLQSREDWLKKNFHY